MIRALGWTTVLAPVNIIQCDDNKLDRWDKVTENVARVKRNVSPIVTSPLISLSTQTTAPAAILALRGGGEKNKIIIYMYII